MAFGVFSKTEPKSQQSDGAANKPKLNQAFNANAAGLQKALTEQEREWKQKTYKKLLKAMDLSLIDSLPPQEARKQIRDITQKILQNDDAPLSMVARQRVVREIEDEVLGLGPLEPLLADPTISDILVNTATDVYVERKGKLEKTTVTFNDDQHLINIIDRIVSSVGRRVDESSPMVDARLADGSRVNAIIPPLAIDGPMLSIRRFGTDLLTMENLIEMGSVPEEVALVLEGVVRAKLNVLISGGTGSGKTTMLNILSSYIPSNERIVTIEDSAELRLRQPHVIRLETRPRNVENRGEITQRDLVKNSLRMRPDRIVIGEVRGEETFDMLQAMNTGHDGSLTTIHANTPRDALSRIENMVSMTGIELPQKALRQQVASAIHVVLQIERQEDGRRRLVSVQEINGMESEMITMSELFRFNRTGIDEDGTVQGNYVATGIVPHFYNHLKQRGIDLPMDLFHP